MATYPESWGRWFDLASRRAVPEAERCIKCDERAALADSRVGLCGECREELRAAS